MCETLKVSLRGVSCVGYGVNGGKKMLELPSGVGLLALGAGLFFFFVLIWGALSGLSFWPRLVFRLIAAILLLILPLSLLAWNDLQRTHGARQVPFAHAERDALRAGGEQPGRS